MNKKDIALNYLKQGLSVIPLFSPEMITKNPPKRYTESPHKKTGREYQAYQSIARSPTYSGSLYTAMQDPHHLLDALPDKTPHRERSL